MPTKSLPANTDKPSYRSALLDLVLAGAVYLLSQIVVATLLLASNPSLAQDMEFSPGMLTVAYIIGGISIICGLYAVMRLRGVSIKSLGVKRLGLGDIGSAILGFIVYFILSVILSSALRSIPGIELDQNQDLGLDNVSNSILPLVFVALVVMPSVSEELLFRGFIFRRLRGHKFTFIVSALVTSLLFGLVHGQLNVAVDTFVLSMVMVFLLEKRKNIWVTILMHGLKNTIAFFAIFIFKLV